jgi:hypothetical protein
MKSFTQSAIVAKSIDEFNSDGSFIENLKSLLIYLALLIYVANALNIHSLFDKLSKYTRQQPLASVQDEPVSKRRSTLVSIQDEPVLVFMPAKIDHDHEASVDLAGYRNFMKQSHSRDNYLTARDMDLWTINLTQKDREEWIKQISPQNKNDCKKLFECRSIWQDILKANKEEERDLVMRIGQGSALGTFTDIQQLQRGLRRFFVVPPSSIAEEKTGKSIFDCKTGHYRSASTDRNWDVLKRIGMC